MADIFLSYSREDQAIARRFAEAFQAEGYEVWWDTTLQAGDAYDKVTEKALSEAKAVVVLWSPRSVDSRWVRAEATQADRNGTLIPAMIEPCKRPIMFELTHTAELSHWRGDPTDKAWLAFLSDVRKFVDKDAPNPAPRAGATSPAASTGRVPLRRPFVLGALGLACVVLIAAVAVFVLNKGPAPPQNQRVAFFGFAATADPVATEIAATATNETLQAMGAERIEIVASGETLGPQQMPRIDRAAQLGARYALSGNIRPEADHISISIRLENVSARTSLWEESFDGGAATPLSVAIQAATRASQTTSCFIQNSGRSTIAASPDLIALVAAYCGSHPELLRPESIQPLRALVGLAPNDDFFQANLAYQIASSLASAPPLTRDALLNEADKAMKRAMELNPEGFRTALAHYTVAGRQNRPRRELEAILQSSLQRVPETREYSDYLSVNTYYGIFLVRTGRVLEAQPYLRAGAEGRPLLAPTQSWYAQGLALAGDAKAADQFEQTFARSPNSNIWQNRARFALFLGLGDFDKLLASPPSTIGAPVVKCWRDIRSALDSNNTKTHPRRVELARTCIAKGDIDILSAVTALAMLGDLAGAFELAGQPGTITTISGSFPPLFWPPTRAMRAHGPRFIDLTKNLGLWEYWVDTGTLPDVCKTKDEKDSTFCTTLRREQTLKDAR